MAYKLTTANYVTRDVDGAAIPFDMANTDCVQFLSQWKSGEATVTNADGSAAPYSDAAVTALGLPPTA